MTAKLALKNLRKSFKDYTIYFLTIAFGVCLFYVFNSLDNQSIMDSIGGSKKEIYRMLVKTISGTSVFVSFILAFLILYANRFLIKRRKKELSIYMLLGMDKRKISSILVFETFFTGLLALAIGIVIGIFASQGLSIAVAKMFEVKKKDFEFSFSQTALLKTMLYFGIIFLVVMIFNVINITRCKLISLMQSARKNEQTKIRNLPISIILFIGSVACLAVAYHKIIKNAFVMLNNDFKWSIILGIIGTVLFFISLSGFLTLIAKNSKNHYYKRLNIFTVRQLTNKINTNCASMTITCLMLLLTIGVIATAFSIRTALLDNMEASNPQDATFIDSTSDMKMEAEEHNGDYDNRLTKDKLEKLLKEKNAENFVKEKDFKDIVKDHIIVNTYYCNLTLKDFKNEKNKDKFTNEFMAETSIRLIKLSDYNKVLKFRGEKEVTLPKDECIITANATQAREIIENSEISELTVDAIELDFKKLKSNGGKKFKCSTKDVLKFQLWNNAMSVNTGMIVINDEFVMDDWLADKSVLVHLNDWQEDSDAFSKLAGKYASYKSEDIEYALGYGITKREMYDSASGISTLATFVSLYIGIIFLVSSCAVLALQQLSESSDNAYRYGLLRKIGASSKDLNSALFKQVGAYFILPLALAVIHSFFGIYALIPTLKEIGDIDITKVSFITGGIVVAVYLIYFFATYFTSKNIISKENAN